MPEDNQNNSSQAAEAATTASTTAATEAVVEKPVVNFTHLFAQDQDYGNLIQKSLYKYDSKTPLANKYDSKTPLANKDKDNKKNK
ncbi:MAG: hypothetical protein LW595_05215 [Rickettsiales bacterium]|nr:hypothetical protein [Rickettsiales bacterium]